MSIWFRWYSGTCEDGKFRLIARNAGVTVPYVIGVWAALLEDASNDEHRGVVMHKEDFLAAMLGVDDEEIQRVLEGMEDAGLISVGHGAITVTKWKERQFETDSKDPTNADRQRRWREKQKANGQTKANAAQTDGNGTVTEEKRPDTESESEKSSGARKRGTRLPDDWRPTDKDASEAITKLGNEGVDLELSKFRDYWKAQSGQRAVKLDWDATWRNWIRNARPHIRNRDGPRTEAGRWSF